MIGKKRTQCWYRECPKRYTFQLRVKFPHGESWEMRGCTEHFKIFWEEGCKNAVDLTLARELEKK